MNWNFFVWRGASPSSGGSSGTNLHVVHVLYGRLGYLMQYAGSSTVVGNAKWRSIIVRGGRYSM